MLEFNLHNTKQRIKFPCEGINLSNYKYNFVYSVNHNTENINLKSQHDYH